MGLKRNRVDGANIRTECKQLSVDETILLSQLSAALGCLQSLTLGVLVLVLVP